MPTRQRNYRHRPLPPNLYERYGYFSWRDPRTGKEYGLGRDRVDAIAQANEANHHLAEKAAGRLVDRLTEARTIASFVPRYRELLDGRELAPLTLYHRKRNLVRIEAELGDVVVGPRQEDAVAITERCATWLREVSAKGKRRMAQVLRTTLVEMFSEMAAAGWTAVNPIEVIRLEALTVRRSRLTIDAFWKIYRAASELDPWVQRSIELGLVTLQRRDDVARMRFRDEEGGRLRVEQGKTGTRLRIPLTLRLEVAGWSLEEIVGRCRGTVLSHYLVHHARHQGRANPGNPVHPQTITAAFREARDLAGISVEPGRTPPTYHELRSLGIRLYQQQAYNPQALAGHKDAATTAVYKDSRGAEWIDVAA